MLLPGKKPHIWSQISSSILMMLSTRSSESETSVVVDLAALRQPFAQQPGYNGIVGGVGGGASKCDFTGTITLTDIGSCPQIPKLEGKRCSVPILRGSI